MENKQKCTFVKIYVKVPNFWFGTLNEQFDGRLIRENMNPWCEGGPVCPDLSDGPLCAARVFTGCLLDTPGGLTLAPAHQCVCQLMTRTGAGAVYRSTGTTFRSSHIVGDICLGPGDARICDGQEDCVGGEDEQRCEEESVNVVIEEELREPDENRVVSLSYGSLMTIIAVGFVIFCVLFGAALTPGFIKICGNKNKSSEKKKSLSIPDLVGSSQTLNQNVYILDKRTDSNRSLKTIKIVREIGAGYFSKVYLAEDKKFGYVAIKTGEMSKGCQGANSIVSEIEIFRAMGRHMNIIQMLDSNLDEKLIVLEYCLYGNCKDYIATNGHSFEDQVDPETGEMRDSDCNYLIMTRGDMITTRCLINWSIGISQVN